MPERPSIVHYDFGSLPYSSYYSTGLRRRARRLGLGFADSHDAPPVLAGLRLAGDDRSTLPMRLLYRYRSGRGDVHFCIDAADDHDNYHLPILERVDHYFKMNHDPGVVARDPEVARFADRIAPIAPSFPVRLGPVRPLVPRLRPCPEAAWDARRVADRLVETTRIPEISAYRRLRGAARELDVFFVTAYYPEDVHAVDMDFRYQVMGGLERLGLAGRLVGFASRRPLPQPFARFAVERLPLRAYLRTMARARVAVYVRGMLECLSFKFGEQLALGLPVAGQRLGSSREQLEKLPHFAEQYACDEPDELVEAVARLLADPARQRLLGLSNARVFDTALSPEVAATTVTARLGLGG